MSQSVLLSGVNRFFEFWSAIDEIERNRQMTGKGKSSATKKYLLRVAGSALILTALFWVIPLDALSEAFSRLTVGDFLLVLAAFLALHLAAALKWWFILDFKVSPLTAIRSHYSGLAAGLCLPGAIGGDAVRGGIVYAATGNGPHVVAAGATDRFIDFAALIILSVIGLSWALTSGGSVSLTIETVLVFLGFTALAVVGFRLLPLIWTVAPSLPGRNFVHSLGDEFATLSKRRLHLCLALCLSAAIQFGLVYISFRLAQAAGAGIEPGHWLFAWPIAKLVAVLPVSLNGLGLREGTLASILAPLYGDAAVILAAGLVWQGVMFAAGGLGALTFLLTEKAKTGRSIPTE